MTSNTTFFSIEHVIIPSRRTFEATRLALESAIQELDMTPVKNLADTKDFHGAVAAMEMLPKLNIFDIRPKNVGSLLPQLNKGKAVQYTIGNPLTSIRMTQWQLGAGLYLPFRVLLRQKDESGDAPAFEYDRPSSSLAQFCDENVNQIAKKIDEDIADVLVQAAGWEQFGQWLL